MSLRAREAKIETSIDHRSRRRHRLLLEVEAKASKSLSSFVTVYDISDTGMLVETDASFIVGEMIEVNLPHAGHQTAEIVWVSGQLIGCKFAEQLTPAAVSAARLSGGFVNPQSKASARSAKVVISDPVEKSAHIASESSSLREKLWTIILLATASWAIVGSLAFLILR